MTTVEHGYETFPTVVDRALVQAIVPHLVALTGPRPRIVVAFSGGIDSTVLAHALMRGRRKLASLRLVHVDHGLQATSADWGRQCARQARSWGVPFTSVRVKVNIKRGDSPEAAAREARYAALEAALEPGEVLVTAQHREDQVETLLLQLFRGAGVAGLAAMPAIAPFGAGRLARPLLNASRASLVDHAAKHKLRWIEDPTNAENRFARNYLRHAVLPAVRTRWVGVDMAIARSARNMSDAQSLLSAIAAADLGKLADGAGLSVAGLKSLPRPRRLNALREFIRNSGARVPSSATTMEIAGNLLAVRADAMPEVHWDGFVMRRRAGRLELDVCSEIPLETSLENLLKSWHWEREREYIVSGVGDRLLLFDDPHGPIDLDLLPIPLEIRARVGGEKLRPGARARTRTLKKLIQAAKMSVEDRARLPLLFAGNGPGDRLVAAGDLWIDASIAANDKSLRRARLRWTKNGGSDQ